MLNSFITTVKKSSSSNPTKKKAGSSTPAAPASTTTSSSSFLKKRSKSVMKDAATLNSAPADVAFPLAGNNDTYTKGSHSTNGISPAIDDQIFIAHELVSHMGLQMEGKWKDI